MLELVLKLIEHLQDLLKLRDANSRAIFTDHIEPIYRDIKTIYDDYVLAFQKTRGALLDVRTPLSSIVHDLKLERQRNLRLRQELVAYSNAFRSSMRFPEEFSTFCYYSSTIILAAPTDLSVFLGPDSSKMGPFIQLLEQWSDPGYRERFYSGRQSSSAPSEMEFRTFAARLLEGTLSTMANDWNLVMKSYFELRIEHLKPA